VDSSGEDKTELSSTLPDPELNPMLNPTLGRNLGRWAHVYFTSPPEKREEAVQELLKELESQPGNAEQIKEPIRNSRPESSRSFPRQSANFPKHIEDPQDAFPREDLLFGAEEDLEESCTCPACLHKNSSTQRYCGFCGYALDGESAEASPQLRREATTSVRILPAPLAERDGDNWQWLHEKHLAELTTARETRSRWKYFFLVLILIAVPVVYAIWPAANTETSRPTPKVSKPAPQESAPVRKAAPAEAPAVKKIAPPDSDAAASAPREAENPAAASTPANEGTEDAANPPATPTRDAADRVRAGNRPATGEVADNAAGTGPQADYGTQELVQGRRFLYGQGVPQSHSIAAKWLWRSVAKQNVDAVLLLSDLYARGDGVPQSCDQARVLLTAGAKKGSAAAAEKLHLLLNSCR
jgi:hypothetical protein